MAEHSCKTYECILYAGQTKKFSSEIIVQCRARLLQVRPFHEPFISLYHYEYVGWYSTGLISQMQHFQLLQMFHQ